MSLSSSSRSPDSTTRGSTGCISISRLNSCVLLVMVPSKTVKCSRTRMTGRGSYPWGGGGSPTANQFPNHPNIHLVWFCTTSKQPVLGVCKITLTSFGEFTEPPAGEVGTRFSYSFEEKKIALLRLCLQPVNMYMHLCK